MILFYFVIADCNCVFVRAGETFVGVEYVVVGDVAWLMVAGVEVGHADDVTG